MLEKKSARIAEPSTILYKLSCTSHQLTTTSNFRVRYFAFSPRDMLSTITPRPVQYHRLRKNIANEDITEGSVKGRGVKSCPRIQSHELLLLGVGHCIHKITCHERSAPSPHRRTRRGQIHDSIAIHVTPKRTCNLGNNQNTLII